MKKNGPWNKCSDYLVKAVRYVLYTVNVLLLFFLGIRTVKTWISLPFDFSEELKRHPSEPEFMAEESVWSQFWTGIAFETAVFVIGSFLCYETLIKNKEIRKNLLAPFFIAFMLLSAESFSFFLPALDKAREIEVCEQMDLSWNEQKHRCNYMDMEKKRVLAARRQRKKQK